jgi:hypothetical protein
MFGSHEDRFTLSRFEQRLRKRRNLSVLKIPPVPTRNSIRGHLARSQFFQ